ncbi:CRISPR-associated endonuclease Cas2 [uncultured Desulfobacter sp.]|uniref:CRISPR-associated endonuclease Cas2 n=1 Tax=uncultured Desulfobacter sp. TaxID=240139 RepID=UPI002AAAA137|nr:CRISPR-associated endonuclease Cas2 [uncultured Desulfobacter sp.]
MERVYLVCYDICDQKRWRRIYKTMKGYGAWLQLSVFQCRLNKEELLKMTDALTEIMNRQEDHLLIIDIGPAENISLRVESYGKPFQPIVQGAVVI